MMTRTALSDKARNELIALCVNNLTADLDATRYADGLESDIENWNGRVVFEIPARDSRRGFTVSTSFGEDADFRLEQVED